MRRMVRVKSVSSRRQRERLEVGQESDDQEAGRKIENDGRDRQPCLRVMGLKPGLGYNPWCFRIKRHVEAHRHRNVSGILHPVSKSHSARLLR